MKTRAAIVAATLWVLPAALAADWSFDPVFNVGYERNDNPLYVGTVDASAESLVRASARLDLTAHTPRARTVLMWEPSYEWHRQFTELDHWSHLAALDWEHTPTERARWAAALRWSRWDRPQSDVLDPGRLQLALPRTTTDVLLGRLSASFLTSPRSRWSFGLEGSTTDYGEPATPLPPGAPPPGDARYITVSGGWEHMVSELTSWGASYRGSWNDEGDFGDWQIHRLLGDFRRGATGTPVWRVSLGAALARQDAGGGAGASTDDATAIGRATVTGPVSERSEWEVGVRRDVTGTGGLRGVVIDNSIYTGLRLATGLYSTLELTARFSRLGPLGSSPSQGTTKSRSLAGEWAAALSRQWRVFLGGEYVDQYDSLDPALDVSYKIWKAGLRWAPTARRTDFRSGDA